MKKQIIGILLVFSLACGAGLLRLHDGQIQEEQSDGSWKCVNDKIRQIVNNEGVDGFIDICANDSITIQPSDYVLVNYNIDTDKIEITTEIYDPNKWTIPDAFIRSMCESGRICEVMGHQWGKEDYFSNKDDAIYKQKCNLCGKIRKKYSIFKE